MIRFFKSKLFILLLITIIIFIIIGFSANKSSKINWISNLITVPLSPVQGFFSFLGQKVEDNINFLKDIKAVKQENEELKEKISELENEKRQLLEYKDKIDELKEVLNLKNQFEGFDFIGANIIAKDPGNWFNVFSIDRGSKDGIMYNFPVITRKGLVGKVLKTDFSTSKVISIIDMDSTVSARLTKTRELVLIKGDITLKEQGLCRMDYISPDVDISVGDTVETSGVGGIYPKGIMIGTVKEIRQTNNELSRYAIIQPVVDFKRLEEVFVLKAKNNTELGSALK